MGGRFCSFYQLYKNFSGNDVLLSPKLNEDQKQEKGKNGNVFTKLDEDQKKKKKKKRYSPQFATIFGRKFVGSFSHGWLFFV